MATRRATRKYETLFEFVNDYTNSLKNNAINLPAGSFRGELANSIKLDLSIPEFERIGPIEAQVIFRDPSGSVALRIPSAPPELHTTFEKAKAQCMGEAQPYVDAGLVIFKSDHDQKVKELEQKLDDQKKEWERRLREEIAKLQAETETKLEALKEELEAQRAAAPAVQTERGISIVDFSELAVSAEGKMEQFHDFLLEASKKQWTGLLYIDQGSQRRFAYLDQGAVVAWRSDPIIEKEVLGVLLYNFKQITKEQLEQSLALMEEKGIRQGEAFVELGFMNFPQMVTVLSKQVEYIFQQVRTQKRGEFSFYECKLPEKFLATKLYYINILMREIRIKASKMPAQALFKPISTALNKNVYLEAEVLPSLRFATFSPEERKTLQFIQTKALPLKDLIKVVPIPKADVNNFFWMMMELGALSFDAPTQKTTSQTAVKQVDPDALLDQKIQEIEKGTHFDVLGLHWICVNADVENAFAEQSKLIDILKNKEEFALVSSGIKDAYEVMKNADERRAYRSRLFHSKFLEEAATLLAQKGEDAISKKDKTLACICFAKAIELCPQEAQYKEGLKRAALS